MSCCGVAKDTAVSWDVMVESADDVEKIIADKMKYLGISTAMRLFYTVGMQDPIGEGYISYDKLKELENQMNKELKVIQFDYRVKGLTIIPITIDVQYKLAKNIPYEITESEVTFRFDMSISNIRIDGKQVRINPKHITQAFGEFSDIIWENESLTEESDSITYTTIEPEIQIKETDIYTVCVMRVKKLDGKTSNEIHRGQGVDFLELFEPLG